MSTHDRGAFGALLAEAKALGVRHLSFDVRLMASDDDEFRWSAETVGGDPPEPPNAVSGKDFGRTGEEALRRLVESLKSRV